MRTLPAILLFSALAAGCGGARAAGGPEIEEAVPAWKTDEGRYGVRVEVAEQLIESDAVDAGLAVLATLRDEGSDSPELDILQARGLMKQGLLTEADRLLTEARLKLPKDPRIPRFLGVIYADQGRLPEAIEQLERSTKLNPLDGAAWNNLGFLLLAEQRYPEALKALQEAVALDGTKARYRNNLAMAYVANDRTADALAALKGANLPADAHANLGLALELKGDDAEARSQYKQALTYDPDNALAQAGLGRVSKSTPPSPPESP